MNDTQLELAVETKPENAHLRAIADEFVAVLETQRRWITIAQLIQAHHGTHNHERSDKPLTRDKARHALAASGGRITSGPQGVRLTRLCTRVEIDSAISVLSAQINGAVKRRTEILRAFHSRRKPESTPHGGFGQC